MSDKAGFVLPFLHGAGINQQPEKTIVFPFEVFVLEFESNKRFDRDAVSMPASASVELREGLIRLALALDVLDLVFRLPRLGRALARLLFSEI